MTNQTIRTIALSNAEKRALYDRLPFQMPDDNDLEGYLARLFPVYASLPTPVLGAVLDFKRKLGAAALLIKNLPIDDVVPATPLDGKRPKEKTTFVSEANLLGFSQVLGEPFSYKNERDGELIPNLSPVQKNAEDASGTGSKVILDLHNDIAHLWPHYPGYTALFCLRRDSSQMAKTLLIDMVAVCTHFTDKEIDTLYSPVFQITPPQSFRQNGHDKADVKAMSILHGPRSMPEVTLQFNTMRPITPEAEKVFDKLKTVCTLPEIVNKVGLDEGDLLIINNRKAVHGRTPFKPAFDGTDRWLQRLYIRENLWDVRSGSQQVDRICYL